MSLEEFEKHPHTLTGVVEKWAGINPYHMALFFCDTGREVSYKELLNAINAMAFKLFNMDLRKGDICVTSLPNSYEHFILGFACMKLGVMWCPLDLSLKPPEIMISLALIRDKIKMYCHLGKTKFGNFGTIGYAIRNNYPWLDYVIQFGNPHDKYREGILNGQDLFDQAEREYEEALSNNHDFESFENECIKVDENDPILLLFTMGTTAFPKPAMLTSRGISCQNMCLSIAFNITKDDRMLVNMPPAFIGGLTEQLMTILFQGGSAIVLSRFDAERSLSAIQNHRVTCLGQIPASYSMEWSLKHYDGYDLSSLKHAIYSGQSVDIEFLKNLAKMAPKIGTGLGLTETSGLCTYTPDDATIEDITNNLGTPFPIYPATIRAPMKEDGSAGEILKDREIGEICFEGPQTFLGYFNYDVATRDVLSTDSILYTGDMGYKDEKGIHLAGRKKYMINPKGYRVFQPEIEAFISLLPEIEHVGVLGAKHAIFTEAIVVYIKIKKGAILTEEGIAEHCKEMASYKRPSLIVFLEDFPLTRNNEPDYVILQRRLNEDVNIARANGKWDCSSIN
ncbi:MAG: acyl--CoA ligase [Candidatus Lokiarchaeota archaeon]|nr:acyl--CoA ligase [Candidatus Lokiarchaeota archaeon]